MRYAFLLLVLALAGCSSYEHAPLAYQAPEPTWVPDYCKGQKVYCRVGLQTTMQGGGNAAVYAGYNGGDLIIGFETPPNTGVPVMLVDGVASQPTKDLGCTPTKCQAGWVLPPPAQRRVLSAHKLAIQDTRTGQEVALSASSLAEALKILR